ncbi:MAG TPA: tetratricopeptide repeat protein [Anaeromyxobacteraceae bacterium]|nr:tetratricopeptide repeat protein [Anaeromyxobacteraceae bacterium]
MPRIRSIASSLVLALAACASRAPVHPRAAEELVRGYAHLEASDLERAEVAFAHALEFDPDLPEALNGLGIVERSRERPAEALRRFEEAVHLDPEFAEAHANRGEALLALGRERDGELALRAALAIDPDHVPARQNLARALLHRGLARPAERDALWTTARREYLHLLETDPRGFAAHHDLGFMAYEAGRFAEAEAAWARAAELEPRSPEALHGLCVARARQGKCDEAVAACERCLAAAPASERCAVSLNAAKRCARR